MQESMNLKYEPSVAQGEELTIDYATFCAGDSATFAP